MFIFVLWACANTMETPSDFAVQYASSQCYAYKQCYRMLFDGKYDGMQDCEDKVSKNFAKENADTFDGCTFQVSKAEECILTIDSSTCGELWDNEQDIYTSCHEDVWTCQ